MNAIEQRRRVVRELLLWCLVLSMVLGQLPLQAQAYRAGDIVEDFALINRATGQPMKLSEFEGKIVFLDWFAWWCPFCQAAAPQLLGGIDQYYQSRNGNPAGIPVVHVGVNLQSGQEAQTGNFVERAQLEIVLEDFTRSVARQFASGGQPIFAIINGVANSPSHRQWELLYSQLGYGQTQFPIEVFRAAIDSVQKSSVIPVTIVDPPWSHTVAAGSAIRLEVTATGTPPLSYQWQKDGVAIPGATESSLSIPDVEPAEAGPYQVVVSNAAGSVTSAIAVVAVLVPPMIITPPASLAVLAGGHATLSVLASGTPPLSYQWLRDGQSIPTATGSSLALAAVRLGDAGIYSVVVSNPGGSVTSVGARLDVLEMNGPPPRLTPLRAAADGAFELEFLGSAGRGYRIEASANLIQWTIVETIRAASGPQIVRDPAAQGVPHRYYRSVAEPDL